VSFPPVPTPLPLPTQRKSKPGQNPSFYCPARYRHSTNDLRTDHETRPQDKNFESFWVFLSFGLGAQKQP